MKLRFIDTIKGCLIICSIPLILFLIPLRKPLFGCTYSTVIFDRDGRWIQGEMAEDEQWRFPPGEVPEKFKQALIQFEDKRFYHHGGVRPESILRAFLQNLKAGEIVSGGSTLTMQTVRISRQKERTYFQKLVEMILAVKWEMHLSKEEILQLYAAHAPFGSNIVGLEAASYRYFGTSPAYLSWGEAATLAVLPNAPTLMYPGKNTTMLEEKRNRLLRQLYNGGVMDSMTLELALAEPVPMGTYPFPQEAQHLLLRAGKEGKTGQRIESTLDLELQQSARYILERHHRRLSNNAIENAACIILGTASGEVLAYVGNTEAQDYSSNCNSVDNIAASRSTGSTLKPFLYASLLNEGIIMPGQLIPDYPMRYKGFIPENYTHSYQGMVPAREALIQSLNVPMVSLLNLYGIEKFHDQLETLDFPLPYSASHYGLTLIVGGAESSLWELSALYAGMGRTLLRFESTHNYYKDNFHNNVWDKNDLSEKGSIDSYPPLGAGAIWKTLEELREVTRPDEEAGWIRYDSSSPMAWKTGTSWGFRDSWSIGITPEFVIAVWTGNSTGEGRPGNTGSRAAAPILFDMADILPQTTWFSTPYYQLEEVDICSQSHMLAGPDCEKTYREWVPKTTTGGVCCIYHQVIHLDESGQYRVDSTNYPVDKMQHQSWFVLPPVEEWYYQYHHSDYQKLPPLHPLARDRETEVQLEWIYPGPNSRVRIPIEVDGSQGKVLLQAAHRDPQANVHWFMDGTYLGSTYRYHQMELSPLPGKHQLTISDEEGNQKNCIFEVE